MTLGRRSGRKNARRIVTTPAMTPRLRGASGRKIIFTSMRDGDLDLYEMHKRVRSPRG